MRVVGFVGDSGTGKSHRAIWVAKENNLEYIIDDGLLIKDSKLVAGSSAKKKETRLSAVRHALFVDKEYQEQMRSEIKRLDIKSVLIIGTSEDMIKKIAGSLDLEQPEKIIRIEDVASNYEIQQALYTRKIDGKHVIPVPTLELKKDFSGYFLDPLQVFRRQAKGSFELAGEKSVVRPSFSYLGKFTISDYAIYQICSLAVESIKGISKISRFRADKSEDTINIEMDLTMIYGYNIKGILREAQEKIGEEIEKVTTLSVNRIKLHAKNLIFEKASQ
jgi:uncharacterized alkaline shock family protein YloU